MPSLNLHSLFDSSSHKETYFNNITLSETDRGYMQSCRTDIRARLRTQLPKELKSRMSAEEPVPQPRFFTQGSWAYKTLNAPCKAPQQADLDDGTYLPFSYVENTPPSHMSGILFSCVEKVLGEMAKERGWRLISSNPNCTRLEISDTKHIDVPVYSIPDTEFVQLSEARLHKAVLSTESYAQDDNWDLMPTHGVLMATKDRGWRANDPRPIKDWVNKEVALKTEQLRRVMRYLKAWRDFQSWDTEEPKSILLMVAAAYALDDSVPRRDDLALLKVVMKLPRILSGKVINPATASLPADEQEDLAARLDTDGNRQEVIDKLKRLGMSLSFAINDSGNPSQACDRLAMEFGPRMPRDANRIAVETVITSPIQKTQAVLPIGNMTAG